MRAAAAASVQDKLHFSRKTSETILVFAPRVLLFTANINSFSLQVCFFLFLIVITNEH